MIDNFDTIEQFMKFEPGTFYKFESLVRNTDGKNDLFEEGESETNKNILIKSWYVDNQKYYERIKPQMIKMAELTGARIYITLDKKSNAKLVQELLHRCTDYLCEMLQGKEIGIKTLSKMFASCTSVDTTSAKHGRTIMFDVDTSNRILLEELVHYIEQERFNNKGEKIEIKAYILKTRKGYHVFCRRLFDTSRWQQQLLELIMERYKWLETPIPEAELAAKAIEEIQQVSMKPNELGLVYHPMKGME